MKRYKTYIITFIILLIATYTCFRDYRIDYFNCNSYIFEGNNPVIELRGDFNLSSKSKITVKLNNIPIKFKRTELNITLFSKVKKKDTLELNIDNNTFKIYDFKNYGWRQKAGRERGQFNCFLQEYKINAEQIENAESTKIYVDKY